MNRGNKIGVIIVAGGSGMRMGSTLPKQFMPLCGKPILLHTLEKWQDAFPEADVIISLPEEYFDLWDTILKDQQVSMKHSVCKGGENRFQSVKNALVKLPVCDIVAIHDGVRPLVSVQLLQRTVEAVSQTGAAIPVIDPVDSFRLVSKGGTEPVDRSLLKAVQTPQCFSYELISNAYNVSYREKFTDDASVAEYSGAKIFLCEGEKNNIKITTPEDLFFAEALLGNGKPERSDQCYNNGSQV